MFIYPENLRAKPMLWLWELRDIGIIGIAFLLSVLALSQGAGMVPLVITVLFSFLTIRVDGSSILDFLRRAACFLILQQHLYGEHSDLLALSLKIGWTQNVIILEADLNLDERRWYLRATAQFGWSKAELKQKIDSASHLEIDLDESENTCYTDSKNTNLEPTTHEQDTLYLSWKYLQKPDGRVCNEGLGEESRAGEKIPDRVSSYKYRGNWQSGLSSGSSQTGGTWHQLFGQKSSSVIEQRLRAVRPVDWHGQCQPSEYVQNLRGRLCRQNAPPDGFYRPPRRNCRSVVHRQFRGNMAKCIGRLSGAA